MREHWTTLAHAGVIKMSNRAISRRPAKARSQLSRGRRADTLPVDAEGNVFTRETVTFHSAGKEVRP